MTGLDFGGDDGMMNAIYNLHDRTDSIHDEVDYMAGVKLMAPWNVVDHFSWKHLEQIYMRYCRTDEDGNREDGYYAADDLDANGFYFPCYVFLLILNSLVL